MERRRGFPDRSSSKHGVDRSMAFLLCNQKFDLLLGGETAPPDATIAIWAVAVYCAGGAGHAYGWWAALSQDLGIMGKRASSNRITSVSPETIDLICVNIRRDGGDLFGNTPRGEKALSERALQLRTGEANGALSVLFHRLALGEAAKGGQWSEALVPSPPCACFQADRSWRALYEDRAEVLSCPIAPGANLTSAGRR